jgi:hypothetical protein
VAPVEVIGSSTVSGVDGRTAEQLGDELYALPPQRFTAARDAAVAEAKSSGDRDLAAALAAMKRPTLAAWLVNLVALKQPSAVQGLTELGQTIREAQGSVTPTQLRDLSAQRRRELDAIVATARTLAMDSGEAEPGRAHLAEVESTFAAAMADDDSARLVRAGRVLKSLSYAGFGGSVGTVAPRSGPAASARAAEAPSEAEAAKRRAVAEQSVAEARRILADATTAETTAERTVEDLAAQIADLREQLDAANREARATRQARIAAERDLAAAQRRLHRSS